jgi:hypothetical protein
MGDVAIGMGLGVRSGLGSLEVCMGIKMGSILGIRCPNRVWGGGPGLLG